MKERFPNAGDAVRLVEPGWRWAGSLIKIGAIGIIDGAVGVRQDTLRIVWNFSAFRGYGMYGAEHCDPGTRGRAILEYFEQHPPADFVSCSGGPATAFLPSGLLVPTGELVRVLFWCWRDRPKANGGEGYWLDVPLWTWDGQGYD